MFIGTTLSDVCANSNQRGTLFFLLCGRDRGGDCPQIIVHLTDVLHVPIVRLEPTAYVFAKSQVGVSLDGDMIVVVEAYELGEAQGASQRSRFSGYALHHVTVTSNGVGMVIDDGIALPVEILGEPTLSDGHAYSVSHSLPQWAGCCFHARRHAVLRMPRGQTFPLAKSLQFFHREFIAGEVQEAVQQHRGMPGGEHEAVPVLPIGIARIMFEKLGPENIR